MDPSAHTFSIAIEFVGISSDLNVDGSGKAKHPVLSSAVLQEQNELE
jgi:hypothetical protein